jgi:hypothetical protein
MAEAVQELWPGTQVTIGPVIENGFYYDFARDEPFTPEDLPVIEKKMREIIARNAPFTKEVWSRDEARKVFAEKGEAYKVELIDAIPEDQDLKIYRQGDWFDLCRGPHMASTGQIGNAFKLMKVAGAYWRGDSNNPMLTRIYGTAWADQAQLDLSPHAGGGREARPPPARPRDGPVPLPGGGAGRRLLARQGLAHVPELISYMRRRLDGDYEEVNAPQVLDKACGRPPATGAGTRRTCSGAVGRRGCRGQARLRAQADELPRPRADLQAWPEVLPRSAVRYGRIRRRSSLRAVRRAARADARARLHAGRCARLLHGGAARGGDASRSTT